MKIQQFQHWNMRRVSFSRSISLSLHRYDAMMPKPYTNHSYVYNGVCIVFNHNRYRRLRDEECHRFIQGWANKKGKIEIPFQFKLNDEWENDYDFDDDGDKTTTTTTLWNWKDWRMCDEIIVQKKVVLFTFLYSQLFIHFHPSFFTQTHINAHITYTLTYWSRWCWWWCLFWFVCFLKISGVNRQFAKFI